jgi:hypothetical protein
MFDRASFITTLISKAFDTVWIKGLLLKLERYGIGDNLLIWLKSYLSIDVSSANNLPKPVIPSAMSFINTKNNNGPKTDP